MRGAKIKQRVLFSPGAIGSWVNIEKAGSVVFGLNSALKLMRCVFDSMRSGGRVTAFLFPFFATFMNKIFYSGVFRDSQK